MPEISRGTVFWREAQNQAVNTSGKGHHWLVLLDPVDEDGAEQVLWVPLSSFKPWLDRSKTYVFNVGRSNKYIDARNDSCPMLKYAEVTTVERIVAEESKRHHEINGPGPGGGADPQLGVKALGIGVRGSLGGEAAMGNPVAVLGGILLLLWLPSLVQSQEADGTKPEPPGRVLCFQVEALFVRAQDQAAELKVAYERICPTPSATGAHAAKCSGNSTARHSTACAATAAGAMPSVRITAACAAGR